MMYAGDGGANNPRSEGESTIQFVIEELENLLLTVIEELRQRPMVALARGAGRVRSRRAPRPALSRPSVPWRLRWGGRGSARQPRRWPSGRPRRARRAVAWVGSGWEARRTW